MQKHAYFITTARGGIHDEDALAAALTAKQINGAGLDVWEDEPPPSDHPLLRFDNVVVSPHTAGITRQSRHNIAKIAAEQMLDILDGKKPPRLFEPRGLGCLLRSVRADSWVPAGGLKNRAFRWAGCAER